MSIIKTIPESAQKLYYDGTNLTGTEITIDSLWQITEQVKNRSVMECNVTNANNTALTPGKECYLYDKDGEKIWGGIIKKYKDKEIDYNRLEYKLRLVDFSWLPTRILATISYENRTIDYIVKDLISRYIGNSVDSDYDLGITEGTIETNLVELNIITFNYISVFDALNKLCEFGNFVWNIDKDKELHFYTIGYVENSTILDRNNNRIYIKDFRRERNIDNYRNHQVVKGSDSIEDIRSNETPSPVPDGDVKTFMTKYRIAKRPTIQVSTGGGPWINKTVGELGKDSDEDYDFFWSYGSRHISQSDSDSALTSNDEIRVSYQPLIPIMVIANNETEITSMGMYQDFKLNTLLQNKLDALTYASELITEYAQIADNIKVSLYEHTYNVMEKITVNDDLRGIESEKFLVESCIWKPHIVNHANIVYEYTMLDGAALGGWEEFFANLLKPKKITLYDKEILILLHEYEENRTHAGDYNITIYTDLLSPSATLQPTPTLTPNNSANSTDSVSD